MARLGKRLILQTECTDITNEIIATGAAPGEAEALRKDAHVVEAALAADRIVVSTDDKMRDLLDRAATQVVELLDVAWVNPVDHKGAIEGWLRDGAPREGFTLDPLRPRY